MPSTPGSSGPSEASTTICTVKVVAAIAMPAPRPPKGRGAEIVSNLETVLKRNPKHPGAIHLYIHAVEASTTPERALPRAERLGALMPGADTSCMPAHIPPARAAAGGRARQERQQVSQALAAAESQAYYNLLKDRLTTQVKVPQPVPGTPGEPQRAQ